MPIKEFQLTAYADEMDCLTTRADLDPATLPKGLTLTPGRAYPITTGTYTFSEKFTRVKPSTDEDAANTTETHNCELTGMDRYIQINDDTGSIHKFMDKPKTLDDETREANRRLRGGRDMLEFPESMLWHLFQRPDIQTAREAREEEYNRHLAKLKLIADNITEHQDNTLPPFSFYPGQLDYIARCGTKDRILVAADTGCGKTLISTTLLRLHLDPLTGEFKHRALIIAPQATLRSEGNPSELEDAIDEEDEDPDADAATIAKNKPTNASQWISELKHFAPGIPIYQIFTAADLALLTRDFTTDLPYGIYVTYYEAMFRNGAREFLPDKWNHTKLCDAYQFPYGPTHRRYLCKQITFDNGAPIPYADNPTDNPPRWLYQPSMWKAFNPTKNAKDFEDAGGQNPDSPINEWARTIGVGTVFHHPENPHKSYAVIETLDVPYHDYTEGVGQQKFPKTLREQLNANKSAPIPHDAYPIRCIASPSLQTIIETRFGNPFDMTIADEAHIITNLDAQVTRCLIRIQSKYRYALTATPIPNVITNLFPIMGWLCVDRWFMGHSLRNAAWPYTINEKSTFENTFLSYERDHTEEQKQKAKAIAKNSRYNSRACVKKSPVISSPARLLKLISPTLAFISKESCNPDLVPCKVIDIRVPQGSQQSTKYTHFLNRKNIPAKNPLQRARLQITYLRGITADPVGFKYGGPPVTSNANPKTLAILDIAADLLAKGEQVLIVTARIGQTNTLHWALMDVLDSLKMPRSTIARIDSTMPAELQSHESNRFKSGKARIMLMGIKCAKAFSFNQCPNLIVGSLEYSFGSLHQAKGRVWRVNSTRPVTVYCILHQHTIEELMFDVVATKQDAATLCLHGQRVPREFKPVDLSEILAKNILNNADAQTIPEANCELHYATELRPKLLKSMNTELAKASESRRSAAKPDSAAPANPAPAPSIKSTPTPLETSNLKLETPERAPASESRLVPAKSDEAGRSKAPAELAKASESRRSPQGEAGQPAPAPAPAKPKPTPAKPKPVTADTSNLAAWQITLLKLQGLA